MKLKPYLIGGLVVLLAYAAYWWWTNRNNIGAIKMSIQSQPALNQAVAREAMATNQTYDAVLEKKAAAIAKNV